MAASKELGIKEIHSFHFATQENERSHKYYTEKMGWRPVAISSEELEEQTGQSSTIFQNGDIRWVVSTPLKDTCRAARFLNRHPAGVMSVSFEVADVERAWNFLNERGATPIHKIRTTTNDQGGSFKHFSIATPIGDLTFRFIEKNNWEGFAPGFDTLPSMTVINKDNYRYKKIDHITCNVMTMSAVELWFEHVLGMERCWGIEFHTEEINENAISGTGLKSVVMWDPASGIKFPINEPMEPFFKEGQINQFVEDNCGGGVQHIALEVDNILKAAESLTGRGVRFLETPDVYYEPVPARLKEVGVDVNNIKHKIDDLKPHGLLIDGSPTDQYMLQVFFKDAATYHEDKDAGPFFFEIIERQGDQGFGGGNFRALFEAIELEQNKQVEVPA